MRESIRRLRDGTIALRLVERERVIVRALVSDLREIIGDTAPVPGLTEIDEDGMAASTDDGEPSTAPDGDAIASGDPDDARRSNLDVVEATHDARSIDDPQAEAWLHVLNDLRLVMGTRLDVTE